MQCYKHLCVINKNDSSAGMFRDDYSKVIKTITIFMAVLLHVSLTKWNKK